MNEQPLRGKLTPVLLINLMNFISLLVPAMALALPPAEDIPEEVLRTEIILEGRSPIDGKALSAREYAELQADLAQRATSPQINSDIQQIIFSLQIRKLFRAIIPFY